MSMIKSFLTENFHYSSTEEEDVGRNLGSLIKYSDGFFKSEKQAAFFKTARWSRIDRRTDKENLKNYFNVEIEDGQYAISVGGMMSWADYGTNGYRPVTWYFVMDDLGVVRKYKLGYVGTLKSGTSPDPKKTKVEFERTASAKKPDWASDENLEKSKKEKEQKAADLADKRSKMSHLAKVGEKIENIEVTVAKIIDRGYGEYGQEWLTIFKTSDNNLIYWNNRPKDADEGTTLTIKKTTVKKEITTKAGDPAIVITRPSFKK